MGTVCSSAQPEEGKKMRTVPEIAGGSHSETAGDIKSARKGQDQNDLAFNAGAFVREQKGKITDFYNLQSNTLGSGAYGKVVKGVHKITGMMRAIKIIHKASASKEEQERLVNEVEILKQLDHPHIIKIFDFLQDEKDFYIACELCTGGELFDKIIEKKFFSEKMAADLLQQVLSAVHYCHTHKIVHRDLKPENILYESTKDNSQIKVIDFGTSRAFDPNEKMHQKFGTPYYIAPEILKKKYDQKCDVWSCGVIAYILMCGYPPFNGPNDKAIMDKVAKGLYTFEGSEWKAVSTDAKEFIRKLLELDPTKRYTALEAMNDPWLKKISSSTQVDKPLMISAFNNLKTFRADRKLAEATWVFLVSVMASKEEKAELLKLFKALDKNNDGLLSRDELLNGYREYSKSTTPEADIEAIMKAIDTNKSGVIDYSEFVMATIDRESLLSKQRLEAAFKMFDKDGNGLISKEELKDFFSSSNMKMEENVWTNLIKEVDANGDGQVSFAEFKEMMIRMM